jgi:hypothetical protein
VKVYALWFGGSSYSAPEVARDTEEFRSIKQAKRIFDCREDNSDGYTPCVESSEMQLFFSDPRESSDPYPDRIIRRGKRGAVLVERC